MNISPVKIPESDSAVWVWDSTWLPAVVVNRARTDCVLVRLEHGVTFSVKMANVATRDPACRGGDMPARDTRFRVESRRA